MSNYQFEYLIGLGSSLGDRLTFLQNGVKGLQALDSTKVIAVSKVYESSPVGPAKNLFLNAACSIESDLMPKQLLDAILDVEKESGRLRDKRWDDRTLDLDILLIRFKDKPEERIHIAEEDLSIPHPRMLDRSFVMIPAVDVASNWEHPVYQKSLKAVLDSKPHLHDVLQETDLQIFSRNSKNEATIPMLQSKKLTKTEEMPSLPHLT